MTEPVLTSRRHDRDDPTGQVSFTAMADGSPEDYALLDGYERAYAAGLGNRVLAGLERLADSIGGYQVSRLDHSLQAATRARLDGAGVEWVVAALVHDIGDELAPFNHSELAAALLQPYVAEEVHWVVRHHGVFQSYYYAHHLGGDRNARDRYRHHRWAGLCEEFCHRWDQSSFDPGFPTQPLDAFTDDVAEIFGREAWDPAVVGVGSERLS
jgi:predicted HD phosphohydrolase